MKGSSVQSFRDLFGLRPEFVVRSPGRINLIGDHTDYNDGFVLPMAIDRAVELAGRPRQDHMVRVYSTLKSEWCEFSVQAPAPRVGWCSYLAGVAYHLVDTGHELAGWEGVISSDLPAGSGLSSSAALELASAMAFARTSGIDWDPIDMALVAHRAENEWVGMQCGVMDQIVVSGGIAGHALLVDCRTLEVTPVAVPSSAAVVVLDTGMNRELTSSAYNERRNTCEAVAAALGVRALRDVDSETLEARRDDLDDVGFRRARHVINENSAVLAAAAALRGGDVSTVGALMESSHRSLRDDFEVTTPELDAMFEEALITPGCHGARMTGAGFGGAVVSLVERGLVSEFMSGVLARYEERMDRRGSAFSVEPTAGTTTEV